MTLWFRHPACWLSLNLGISGKDDETLTVIETEKASVRTETTVSEWLGPPYLSQSAVTCRVISVASSVSTPGYSAPKCQQYSENVIRDTLAHHETDMLDNFDTRQSFADLYLWILGGIDRFRLSHSSQHSTGLTACVCCCCIFDWPANPWWWKYWKDTMIQWCRIIIIKVSPRARFRKLLKSAPGSRSTFNVVL